MKLALFADIHSNLEAFTACLGHAQSLGADSHAFLGDMVGYGADPVAVLDLVAHHVAKGAVAVLGNHDAAAIGHPAGKMNTHARAAIDWTQTQLGESHRVFLASLPLTARQDNILFVHASASAPARWTYVTDAADAEQSMAAADANYIFCGHVHQPMLYYTGPGGRPMPFVPVAGVPIPTGAHRQWLAIAGSAGQPRDGNNEACYAMFDSERQRLTYFRVPYAHGLAAQKIRAAGLPPQFALRLERGA